MNHDTGLVFLEDVKGAPVRMGEPVRISGSPLDGSLDPRFVGHRGVVVGLVYDEPSTQYPGDPLIQVRVEDLGEDLFFARELERSPEWAWRPLAESPEEELRGTDCSL
ncbi:Carotenogenesis protein CarS [Melittangium boletus]|uniref:Carotenogenesis protein carS n=1 Tax=Melittangium boletus DSM 14713 TaxID=1294270 RepID=A0A250IND0_9BACT|nr:Carotenogenesis protein CarS [Melittangium boletus]ATB32760.1 carotenogenesis protein carS [Melittangium boletus DSM 14713]